MSLYQAALAAYDLLREIAVEGMIPKNQERLAVVLAALGAALKVGS